MRNYLFLLFTIISSVVCAQGLGVKAVGALNYNFDRSYYQTTVDLNGLEAVAMGTADNLVNVGSDLANFFGQGYASIFKGEEPTVVKEGNTTYYNYSDKVIKQELKYVREMCPVIGVEAGLYYVPASMAVGVRTSKYRYFAPDFYLDGKVRPYAAYEEITGNDYHPYGILLRLISVGYTMGNDFGMPGFLNFDDKAYKGFTLGLGSTIENVSWQLEGFMQRGADKDALSQSNVRMSVYLGFN